MKKLLSVSESSKSGFTPQENEAFRAKLVTILEKFFFVQTDGKDIRIIGLKEATV